MVPALIFAALFVVSAISFMVYKMVQFTSQFHPLPGFKGSNYAAPADITEEQISGLLDRACLLLILHGPWTVAQVTETAHKLTIIVMQADEWNNPYVPGQHIAGTSDSWEKGTRGGATLRVGRSLAALCHELAHACEVQYDGAADYGHKSWLSRGIQTACDAFEASLKQ